MVAAASGGDSLFAWFVVSGGKTDTWLENTGCFINQQIWKKGCPFPSTGLEPFIKMSIWGSAISDNRRKWTGNAFLASRASLAPLAAPLKGCWSPRYQSTKAMLMCKVRFFCKDAGIELGVSSNRDTNTPALGNFDWENDGRSEMFLAYPICMIPSKKRLGNIEKCPVVRIKESFGNSLKHQRWAQFCTHILGWLGPWR